jgi:hypothetical protein
VKCFSIKWKNSADIGFREDRSWNRGIMGVRKGIMEGGNDG